MRLLAKSFLTTITALVALSTNANLAPAIAQETPAQAKETPAQVGAATSPIQIDTTGAGWVELGKDDFQRANCNEDT